MYLEHFNLESDPFRLSPDAKFYYGSLGHNTAKEYMDYVLWSRDSFVVITGDIGTGKTTLIQKMLDDAGPKITVAKLHQTQLNEIEFLQALLDQFGVDPFKTDSKVELLSMLNKYLQKKYEEGETVVVIIDEAQNLKPRVLEEIRLLSGFDSNREKLLNIFLVGQPELRDTLFSPQMEQLFQRIRLRFHLEGLGFDEVRSYIRHRLAVSSEKRFYPLPATRKLVEFQPSTDPITLPTSIFSDELMGIILEYTGGIPRLINTLCDTALLTAFANDRKVVEKDDIRSAIEELQWTPYNERTSYRQINSGSQYSFQVFKDGISFSTIELVKEEILVGRSHLCDIKIDQTAVSGKHFKLVSGTNGYIVEDMNSTNGTFVNGNQIERWELTDGDSIQIGNYSLSYQKNISNNLKDQVVDIQSGKDEENSLLDKLTS